MAHPRANPGDGAVEIWGVARGENGSGDVMGHIGSRRAAREEGKN